MAGFNFGSIATALADTTETGVTFEGKAKNWGTEEEAKEVVDAIEACPKLEFLNLEGNTLGVGAAKAIARALEKHPEFKRALWKDLFTGRLKSEIPLALESMGQGMFKAGAQLTILDCSDNALGPNGMKGLVALISSRTCYSLQQLRLNNCGLGIQGARMLAASLTECLEASRRDGGPAFALKVFFAGRNRLENEGAKALGAVFGRIGTLEEVTVPQNGINHDGIRALSEGFKSNTNLRVLNLNDNTVTAKGAKPLAEALEVLNRLVELNLGDCLLRTDGAVLLAEALQDGHNQLEVLNMGFNEIGPNGGLSVAQAMQNKPHINSIVLNGNMFGHEGREQISEMLSDYDKLAALGELDEDDSDNEDESGAGGSGAEDDSADEDEEDEDHDDDDDDGGDDDEEDEYEDGDYVHSDTEEAIDLAFNNQSNRTLDTTVDVGLNDLSQSTIYHDTESANTNTTEVEKFCCATTPTASLFDAIGEPDKIFAFRSFFDTLDESDYLVYVAFAILKCSSVASECSVAMDVALALYKDCFDFAVNTSQLTRVKNFFLIQLGLLRTEDKSYKPAHNVAACQVAVRNGIERKMFPTEVASMFELFLDRFQIKA